MAVGEVPDAAGLAGFADTQSAAPVEYGSATRLLDLRRQHRLPAFAICATAAVAAALAAPAVALNLAATVASLAILAVTTTRFGMVLGGWPSAVGRAAPQHSTSDDNLAPYTVLVPVYREAGMVGPLTRHMARLDYPADRLEILLLCESDDVETISQIEELRLDSRFRMVTCPPGYPRTKPRACNVGLAQARGGLLVIYDAEDRPELDQLRKAAAAFTTFGSQVVCLQARLVFHNGGHNWLTRCCALEYGTLFRLFLPGLCRNDLPVPLGGTSNHFRVSALRELNGWDAFNVTEDADLGLRLHHAGWRTVMLDSSTPEEACAKLTPWIRQRTRWMKGYLQTWAVHSRSRSAPRRFVLATHLVIGGVPLGALLWPAMFAFASLLRMPWWPGSRQVTGPLAVAVATVLVGCIIVQVLSAALAAAVQRQWRLLGAALAMPAYTLLISLATYRALWHLFRQPHIWEKTPHGLSGHDTDPGIAS